MIRRFRTIVAVGTLGLLGVLAYEHFVEKPIAPNPPTRKIANRILFNGAKEWIVADTEAEDAALLVLERAADKALGYPRPTFTMSGRVADPTGVKHHADPICALDVPNLCAMPEDDNSLETLHRISSSCSSDAGLCDAMKGLEFVKTLPSGFAESSGTLGWWCDGSANCTSFEIRDEFKVAGDL